MHHSDHGSQYVSISYTERLAKAGMPSVGSVGDSYDNALVQTINGPYKVKSSIDEDPGGALKPPSSRRWNVKTGSIIGGCWSLSATSCRPKPRNATTPCSTRRGWRRNSSETASGKPGTVHLALGEKFGVDPEAMREMLLASSADNWALSERISFGGMPWPWAEKDMMIVIHEADHKRISLPLSGALKEVVKGINLALGDYSGVFVKEN